MPDRDLFSPEILLLKSQFKSFHSCEITILASLSWFKLKKNDCKFETTFLIFSFRQIYPPCKKLINFYRHFSTRHVSPPTDFLLGTHSRSSRFYFWSLFFDNYIFKYVNYYVTKFNSAIFFVFKINIRNANFDHVGLFSLFDFLERGKINYFSRVRVSSNLIGSRFIEFLTYSQQYMVINSRKCYAPQVKD